MGRMTVSNWCLALVSCRGKLGPAVSDHVKHLFSKSLFRESLRSHLEPSGADIGMPFFEFEHRLAQMLMAGHIVKETAPGLKGDAFQYSSAPKCDDRLPTCEGFDRHYAEVLLAGLNHRPAPGVLLSKFGLRNSSAKFYVPPRYLPQFLEFGAITHHAQRATVSGEADNGIVNTLVLNKLGYYEEVIQGRTVIEGFHVYRGINYLRFTPICLPNTPLHVSAVSNEFVHARGRCIVPETEIIAEDPDYSALYR